MLLLVTGTPCTGKSAFTRWLATTHGYIRCPSGEEPGPRFYPDEIERALAKSSDVVLDWGIPVLGIPLAKRVIEKGFQAWWFDGDRDTGRDVFVSRPGHLATIDDYHRYMAGIEQHWSSYHSLFDDRALQVLAPGPTYMPNDDRLAAIVAYQHREH